MLKGRRTEIDFINGLIAAKGAEVGVPASTHLSWSPRSRRLSTARRPRRRKTCTGS